MKKRDDIIISYDTIVDHTKNISARLRASNIEYNYVIGFGRGGLIPATLIAYELDIPILCCSLKSYDGNKRSGHFTVFQEIDFDKLIPDSNIIVVDDICDTGGTFKFFKKLHMKNVNVVTYASLFAKEESKHNVDLYSTLVSEEWLVFPWEV